MSDLAILGIMGGAFALMMLWLNYKLTTKSDLSSLLKQDLEAVRSEVSQGQRMVADTMHKTMGTYASLQKEMGGLHELGSSMKQMKEFLASPKMRGNMGEQILRDLLEQVMPKHVFDLQHGFQGGEIVDAIVKTHRGLIPIDSKFSLESFRKIGEGTTDEERESARKEFVRAVKKQIQDVSSKYIMPDQGTVDFAIIYVPSEQAYYEIMVASPEILDYGYEKKVYFTSPNTFYYFLKIVMVGLQHAQFEETAKKIHEMFGAIRNETEKLGEEYGLVQKHLGNAVTAFTKLGSRRDKLMGKIETASQLEAPSE